MEKINTEARKKKHAKKMLKKKNIKFVYSIKTLKFNNIAVNKKEFTASKQAIALDLVKVNQILISDTFEHSDKGFRYFTGYKECDINGPLCIILPQISEYIKYFDNGGKNISFMIEDDNVLVKCKQIWNKTKEIR